MLDKVIEKITEQQKGKEYTTAFNLGEHLKDIINAQPELAEIVLQDLEKKELSIDECAKLIDKRADEIHKEKKISKLCVPTSEAEEIIRKFYGLPDRKTIAIAKNIDLSDFI